MRILLKAPEVSDEDLAAYLTDAIRLPGLAETTGGFRMVISAWRGTRTAYDPPKIRSWASTSYDARTFGPVVRKSGDVPRLVLAIIAHTEGTGRVWIEYVTKEACHGEPIEIS